MIKSYPKNEELLEKCTEDYILGIQMKGQMYQVLQAHTEEKLNLADEEIA